jgi:hypothetical protein
MTMTERKVIKAKVGLLLAYSAVTSFFPDPADRPRIVPGFTEALGAKVRKMIEKIPPSDVAIQCDLAVENRYVETTLQGMDWRWRKGRPTASWRMCQLSSLLEEQFLSRRAS